MVVGVVNEFLWLFTVRGAYIMRTAYLLWKNIHCCVSYNVPHDYITEENALCVLYLYTSIY
mgnify:CR=1 FL=1